MNYGASSNRSRAGRGPGYGHAERKAAFDLLNRTERLRPDERIVVRADLHVTLSDTHEVKERIREVSERQRVLKRERSRGTGRERVGKSLKRVLWCDILAIVVPNFAKCQPR